VSDTARLQQPHFPPVQDSSPSGCVRRDERGNAVWEWAHEAPTDELLQRAGLAIADDAAPAGGNAPINRVAAAQGYNPYQSGLIDRQRTARARRRDLQELSNSIKQRKPGSDDAMR
jgi:hypothetical protein